MTDSDESTRDFKPWGEFDRPAMPADQSIRRMGWKLWKAYRQPDEAPFIADESLVGADGDELNELAAPPACGPLLRELSANFADCLTTQQSKQQIRVVVLPPCDRSDVLRTWATLNNLTIAEPPERDALRDREPRLEVLPGDHEQTVVIPRLERWFLRHPSGLHLVRNLLDQLTRSHQSFIIGCNSWAWNFLTVAVQADLLLPRPVTFQAFDAALIQFWLAELATSEDATDSIFRLARSGTTIVGEQADLRASDNFFATLAARSLGIPWVAWQKWRRSLRLGQASNDSPTHDLAEKTTVWVTELEEFHLPSHEVDAALLTLHALLIHDTLTDAELELTTPNIRRSGVIAALLKLGIITRLRDSYSCTPAAYPAIREELGGAGFPLDRL